MKRQPSGFVDVYASIKNGDMSIVSFVAWLDKKKVFVNCSHVNHVGTCKKCKIEERLRK